MAKQLFNLNGNIFIWTEIETFLVRSQYNQMLNFVLRQNPRLYNLNNADNDPRPKKPNFLNKHYCLTIDNCNLDLQGRVATPWKIQQDNCLDLNGLNKWILLPQFKYVRNLSLEPAPTNPPVDPPPEIIGDLDFKFDTNSLTVGAVIWLYFYERMGIFKILGALLDDYNYRGKYTISGRRDYVKPPVNPPERVDAYSDLMDMICTLHRVGISSNLRDRICLYQRVLGVTIENSLGVESERNTGFMQTFNKLIDYMGEFYRSKQLATAIQGANPVAPPRSSVATQTSIRDTINVLKQHFEPLQYGRNLINTFLGIATVHATLCLVNMLKAEIGIPNQYEKPEEFIPAAYDILVAKRSHNLNQTNRFIIYDNCASYGYRLLTDIEAIDLNELTTSSANSRMDTWLDDVEGVVEGYRNAYSAVPEKVEAIV